MAAVRITVSRGDGYTVEYEQDTMIRDSGGMVTRQLFEHAVSVVRAGLHGAEPTGIAVDNDPATGGNRA